MAAGDPIRTTSDLYKRLAAGTATEGPGTGTALSGQAIYDRFIRPDEQRRVQQIMGGLRQSNTGSRALALASNEDMARRLGFGGTQFAQALDQSTSEASSNQLGEALRRAREQLSEMNTDPARLDVLRRAAEAAQRRITRDTVGNQVWAGIDQAVGAALAAAGGPFAPLGAAIQAIGAGRGIHGGAIIGALGSEQAQRFSPSNIKTIDLAGLGQSLTAQAPRGQSSVGPGGAGADGGMAWRRALQDEYGGF